MQKPAEAPRRILIVDDDPLIAAAHREYTERVAGFTVHAVVGTGAAAMKAVDPTIRIGAIGLRNYGRYRLNRYNNWNEVVLRKAGAAMRQMLLSAAATALAAPPWAIRPPP